ncbi:MAG: ATP-binding protein [Gammaproteobacteria bacterium]|nr:ATP-binding protein [Gammaproteobacteria bacterium]
MGYRRLSFSIRAKLVFFTVSIILLVGGGISWFDASVLRGQLIDHFEAAADQVDASTSAALVDALYFLDIPRLRGELQQAQVNHDVSVAVALDTQGRVLSDGSTDNPLWLQTFPGSIAQRLVDTRQPVHERQAGKIIKGRPVHSPGGGLLGFFYMEYSTGNLEQASAEAQQQRLLLAIAFISFGGLLAWLLAWHATKPLTCMLSAVREIGSGNLDVTLSTDRSDEIGALGESINAMASNLRRTTTSIERLNAEIAEREQTEIRLIEACDDAEKANTAKSDFLSHMSHELRTPLNAILGFGQILEMDAESLNDEQNESIREILVAGDHLLHLINEVLDLAKIESSKLEIFMQAVEVDEVMQQCLSLIVVQAEQRQLSIIDNISNRGYVVQADALRLKQVLLNLLSNAVKYNRVQGTITLDAEIIDGQRLRISIVDTGKGLTEDELARLFKPFERIESDRHVEGSGIGLVISQRLTGLMAGNMGVNSAVGTGSEFWIEFELVNSL